MAAGRSTPSRPRTWARARSNRGIEAVGIDLPDLQLLVQAAVAEHDHSVGELQGFVDVVRDDQDGRPVPTVQLADETVHPDARERIEGPERLVEQHELRLPNERPSEGDPLRFAPGQGQRPGVGVIRHPDLAQRGHRLGATFCPRQADRHVAPDLMPRQEPWFLEHDRTQLGNLDAPLGDRIEARERPQQGGLAATTASDQGHELRIVDGEVESVQDDVIAEGATQPPDLDGGHRAARLRGSCRQRSRRHSAVRTTRSVARPRSA